MQLAIWCLIGYGRITHYCSSLSETCKTYLRSWLGPAPSSYYLLSDGRVIPSTVTIPPSIEYYIYSPESNILKQPASNIRIKRFSWVALEVDGNDLSDWIQSLRWAGTDEPSLLSLITLWATINQRVIPFRTMIHGTKNTAEEIQISYV